MWILDLLIGLGIAVLKFLVVFGLGIFILGIFLKLRHSMTHLDKEKSQVNIATPLLETIKNLSKEPTTKSTISRQTRNLILFCWFFSAILGLFLVPVGNIVIFPNLFGEFQLFAVFSLLMVYPFGLMIFFFLTSRKISILSLKPLAEDFFSTVITFLVVALTLFMGYGEKITFEALPAISDLIAYQSSRFFPVPNLLIPKLFVILNPFAMVAFFTIIPVLFKPMELSGTRLSKKWTPYMEFSGRALSVLKVTEVCRFMTLVILFIDLFIGGAVFTLDPWLDLLMMLLLVLFVTIILSFVRSKKKGWVLDKKVGGFIRSHNIIALIGLAFTIILLTL